MASKSAVTTNPLIATRAPDAPLSVQLHPLVLLTISDYITRHASRRQQGPIVGTVIGQQNGRNFTLEHAYECKATDDGDRLDGEWFTERLEQYRDVHKAPALDLVGVFMLGPVGGPLAAHAEAIKQVMEISGMEGLMLLLFHPELVDQLQGGKLPISLYESVQEVEDSGQASLRFRELSFEVETGEAEMIGVDFVATGGGNATAVPRDETGDSGTAGSSSSKDKAKSKGKAKAKEKDGEDAGTSSVLSAEDEELIASLTAKANAIKMLNQRINLIREYLATLPSSYLTDASDDSAVPPETANFPLLRNINAMLSRLPLLAPPPPSIVPADTTSPLRDSEASLAAPPAVASPEQQSVHLTSLLSTLTRSIAEAQTLGNRFSAYSREKTSKDRAAFGGRGGLGGGAGYADDGGLFGGEVAGKV